MESETTLIEGEEARVTLAKSAEGHHLEVVNADGRARVTLSVAQAEALALAAPGAEAGHEIERKLLVTALPDDLARHPHQRLRQGYLAVTAQASFRIREKGRGSKITIKRGKGLDRVEVELNVSDVQADLLWPLAGRRVIDKTRYAIPDGEGLLELDVYHGPHAGLVTVEREFPGVDAARSWTAPGWAGPDVTEEAAYTNARLALDGLPDDAP